MISGPVGEQRHARLRQRPTVRSGGGEPAHWLSVLQHAAGNQAVQRLGLADEDVTDAFAEQAVTAWKAGTMTIQQFVGWLVLQYVDLTQTHDKAYRAMPTEADAFAVGGAAGSAFRTKAKKTSLSSGNDNQKD